MPAHVMLRNTPLRKVATIDLTRDDPAVIIAPAPIPPHDEAWLINTAAPIERIVEECNGALALMEERRAAEQARYAALRARGQRRALWLLLAAVAGFLLPSPVRGFYRAHGAVLAAAEVIGVVAVGALLVLALWEHVRMRRLMCR